MNDQAGSSRVLHLGAGKITLAEDDERRAVVLGGASLEMSRAVLSSVLLPPDDEGVAWLDLSTTSDLAVGLAEAVRGSVLDPPV